MDSAITTKGQATIPKAIREHLGLKPGDRVKFFIHPNGSAVLLPKLPASALRGMLKSPRKGVTVGFSDADIAAAIARMLQIDALVVENEPDVFTATIELADGHGSFADALIATRDARAECSRTLTFDRKALRLPGFELP